MHGQNTASGQQRGISIPSSFGSFVILADAAHGKVFTRRESSSWLYGSVRHRTVVAICVLQPAHYHSQKNSAFKLCFQIQNNNKKKMQPTLPFSLAGGFGEYFSCWFSSFLVVLLRSFSCIALITYLITHLSNTSQLITNFFFRV